MSSKKDKWICRMKTIICSEIVQKMNEFEIRPEHIEWKEGEKK